MSALSGTAVVFGTDGRTVAFSGVATTDNVLSGSLNMTDAFDVAILKGANGRTIAKGASNRSHRITVDIVFQDTSVGAARDDADGKAKLPGMLGIVTLAGFNNTLYDGDWNYEGGTIADSTEGFRKATLTISRAEKADGTLGAMPAVPAT